MIVRGVGLVSAVLIPLAFWQTVRWISSEQIALPTPNIGTILPDSDLRFRPLMFAGDDVRPRVTNVHVTDLDADGHADILVCDAVRHTVWWKHRTGDDMWIDTPLVPPNTLPSPAHTSVADIDNDGDRDILVAILRDVWPTDGRHGQVVVLINDGEFSFQSEILADDLRRITDVQPADLDGDGDLDLAVAEFGYLHGRVLWLENKGGGQFADHELLSLPGAIHVPIGDFDNDGDPDIAAVISQNHEEVWIFENDGGSTFTPTARRVWSTENFDLGLAGMVPCDLDSDGDTDFLLSAGDNLELHYPCPQPGHGCLWLENKGQLQFDQHRIGTLGGTYAADAADLDGDGDMDVVLASMFNDWKTPSTTSLAWLENDGRQQFAAWHIAAAPTHLATVACGDLNDDGRPDIVAGSLQIFPPFDSAPAGVSIWLNQFSADRSFAEAP